MFRQVAWINQNHFHFRQELEKLIASLFLQKIELIK